MGLDDIEKRVLDALKSVTTDSSSNMVSTNRVKEEVGVHYYRTEKALQELVDEGLVERIEADTVTLWKVADGV